MQRVTSKSKIRYTILVISLVQMSTNGIASILADISGAFPEVPTEKIQLLMTFPSIFIVAVTLMSACLYRYFPKKLLIEAGLLLILLSGILSFLFHRNLLLLYIWSGFLGIGVGFVASLTISLISDYYEGSERGVLMGIQTSAANMGSMVMTLLGGILALISWHYNYLIFLLAIPGIVLSYRYLSLEEVNSKKQQEKVHIAKSTWLSCSVAAFYMLIYYMGPTNIALFISEESLGNTATAGIFATILLSGGIISGLFFGRISSFIGSKILSLGFILLAIGFYLMYLSNSLLLFGIGCFITGASNSFVMPQCMLQVSDKGNSSDVTMAMALVISFCNLGIFITPAITGAARIVMNSDTARDRFLFTSVIGTIGAMLLYFLFSHTAKKRTHPS